MPKNLIIDTNILLLLIIGVIDGQRYIKISKRLNIYNEEDYYNILKIIGEYKKIYVTKYIATEVSNLIDLKNEAREKAFKAMRTLISSFTEIDTALINEINHDKLHIYGITDVSLIKLVENYTILTDDSKMCSFLYHINGDNVVEYKAVKRLLNMV